MPNTSPSGCQRGDGKTELQPPLAFQSCLRGHREKLRSSHEGHCPEVQAHGHKIMTETQSGDHRMLPLPPSPTHYHHLIRAPV